MEIGHFELETVGDIVSGTMRINLFDANVTATIETTKGTVSFTTLTFSSEHLFLIDINTTEGEDNLRLEYIAEQGICNGRYQPEDYVKNPQPECFSKTTTSRTYQVCQHPLLVGGDYAEAYYITHQNHHIRLLATVDNAIPANHLRPISARKFCVENLERMISIPFSQLLADHQSFWHSFYQQSFLSIPDMKWESLYWIQVFLFLFYFYLVI